MNQGDLAGNVAAIVLAGGKSSHGEPKVSAALRRRAIDHAYRWAIIIMNQFAEVIVVAAPEQTLCAGDEHYELYQMIFLRSG